MVGKAATCRAGILAALLLIQLPNAPGKAAEDGPGSWALAPTWETQIKLLALGFGLAQTWPLWSFGE